MTQTNKITCFLLVGIVLLSLRCVNDEPFKFRTTTVPESLGDGWAIAAPESVSLSKDSLEEIYSRLLDESHYSNALALLIVKDGKLTFETYLRSLDDRDHYHHIQSCTKSFTSMAFGIAKSMGKIETLDRTFCSIYPNECPQDSLKEKITLRHLLTMRSGIQFGNDVFSVEMHCDKPDDPIRDILNKPLYAPPGDSFWYRDADPQLISYAIQGLTGKTVERILKENVFNPLGITDYYWEAMPDGATTGAHALHLKPRDMARVGLLMLNNGRWNGKQLIDSTWISVSTSSIIKAPTAMFLSNGSTFDYGYYWWVVPQYGAYTAWGHGGQFIFVVPHQHMVIVMVSMPDADMKVGTQLNGFIDLVNPILTLAP